MYVPEAPQKFVDQYDGTPVERIEPEGSRFDTIEVKLGEDRVIVKSREAGTDRVQTVEFVPTDELYGGLSPAEGFARDVHQDIRTALQLFGYAAVERQGDIREY